MSSNKELPKVGLSESNLDCNIQQLLALIWFDLGSHACWAPDMFFKWRKRRGRRMGKVVVLVAAGDFPQAATHYQELLTHRSLLAHRPRTVYLVPGDQVWPGVGRMLSYHFFFFQTDGDGKKVLRKKHHTLDTFFSTNFYIVPGLQELIETLRHLATLSFFFLFISVRNSSLSTKPKQRLPTLRGRATTLYDGYSKISTCVKMFLLTTRRGKNARLNQDAFAVQQGSIL